jgi:hypothetical protein
VGGGGSGRAWEDESGWSGRRAGALEVGMAPAGLASSSSTLMRQLEPEVERRKGGLRMHAGQRSCVEWRAGKKKKDINEEARYLKHWI